MLTRLTTKLSNGLLRAWYASAPWLWLLWPFSLLYRILFNVARKLAKPALNNAIPVIVIGNITVGGTGKTPLVQTLVSILIEKNIRVGIISRGYGRNDTHTTCLVKKDSTVAMVGDEPLLLFNTTQVPVAVSGDRQAAIALLQQHYQLDVIVSDDGLQHHGLKSDLEWLVIDGQRGLGNGYCLPMGPLRESAQRLHSVDGIWITGERRHASIQVLPKDLPVYAAVPTLASLHQLNTDKEVAWPSTDESIHALAGIGNPQRFFGDLECLGYSLKRHIYADHHDYTEQDLQPLVNKITIMTAKDAVKCQRILPHQQHTWYYTKQSVELPEAAVEQVITKLKRHS